MADTNNLDAQILGRPRRRRRRSRRGLSKAGMYAIILGSVIATLSVAVIVLLLQAQSTSAPRLPVPATRPQAAPSATRPPAPFARPQVPGDRSPGERSRVQDPAPAVPDSWRWTPPVE